ncbi:MAG: PilZ domain-containing protein [Lachnospiraceae bacterium]|nr:PilZ domain-containing protein [Lachnospiraceae bacterium]
MQEKRKHKRLSLSVDIQLERLDQDGVTTLKMITVDVTDISRSGIGFRSDQKLDIDAYFDTKIQIWTKEVINAVIRVVRREDLPDGGYKYGCTFVGITDNDAMKIDIYQIFHDV